MCTERQLSMISREMVKCYRQVYGNEIVSIILYGSYARGDYSEESDIDFAAVVHGEREELQQKLKIIWNISADLGMENEVVISPIVIPYDEFTKYKDILPCYSNIAMEGKKIG